MCRFFRFLLAIFLASPVLTWAEVQSDFDGDGISDLALIQIQSNADLAWKARLSSTGEVLDLGTLGSNGDHIALGHWTTSTKAELGVLSKTNSGAVDWIVKDKDGQTHQFSFGEVIDLFVSGADLDNSGLTDAIYAYSIAGRYLWSVELDPLGPTSKTSPAAFTFARNTQYPFFMNAFGNGDWLAVIAPLSGGRGIVRLKNPINGARKRYVLSKALPVNSRPLPLKLANGRDAFILVKKGSSRTNLRIYSVRGKLISQSNVAATGDIILGNFLSSAYEQIAVQSSNGFIVFDPITKVKTSIQTISGVAIDQININSFSSSVSPTPVPTKAGAPVAPGVCIDGDPTDGAGGFVWKPNSDTQHFAVAVLPERFTGFISGVQTTKTNGEVIKSLRSKGAGNGNRTSWIDDSLTGADYKKTYGSIIVKVNFDNTGCIKYLISNPATRVD